jgi:hypothetical protein
MVLYINIDIEWKAIYIGNSYDIAFDQILETILIGPLQVGVMKFDFEVTFYLKSSLLLTSIKSRKRIFWALPPSSLHAHIGTKNFLGWGKFYLKKLLFEQFV